ncbi:MAG: hypothetical protein LBJ11_07830 [Oscillospiraceae bacterium]|jgi:hypothetical protein|nr:hypothetical protein [Oscillospiraceae bacterium]
MSPIRQEVQDYIDLLPDLQLEALKPLLTLLARDSFTVETDLTEEEKAVIQQGRAEYAQGGFVPLASV